jgi:hypothetical protein
MPCFHSRYLDGMTFDPLTTELFSLDEDKPESILILLIQSEGIAGYQTQ